MIFLRSNYVSNIVQKIDFDRDYNEIIGIKKAIKSFMMYVSLFNRTEYSSKKWLILGSGQILRLKNYKFAFCLK